MKWLSYVKNIIIAPFRLFTRTFSFNKSCEINVYLQQTYKVVDFTLLRDGKTDFESIIIFSLLKFKNEYVC